MRRIISAGVTLAFVFGMTLGITFNLRADPIPQEVTCIQCYYDGTTYCSDEFVPDCYGGALYGYYEEGACEPGGTLRLYCRRLIGCCTADCICYRWIL